MLVIDLIYRVLDSLAVVLWDRGGKRRLLQQQRREHTEEVIRANLTVRRSAARQIVRTQRLVSGRDRWT